MEPSTRAHNPHATAAALRLLADWLGDLARQLTDATEPVASAEPAGARAAAEADSKLLTARELEVVACIARGLSNRQIAAELVIANGTTERHVANILRKLGMRSRAQVAAWAATRRGVLQAA
jgi:DNA-binding NarL/FixJ family response regulator